MAIYRPINPDFYKPDINPADRNRIAIEAGYTGTEDALNNLNKERQGGGGTNATIGSMGGGSLSGNLFAGPQNGGLDLQALYKNLSGDISITQSELDRLSSVLTEKQKRQAAAAATINDNPWYSEGTRLGRIDKLNQQAQADQLITQNEQKIALEKLNQQKAERDTQIGLATKQFDINTTAANQALNQFNTLLASGALDGASPSTLATITSATGLSSEMINAAVNAQKAKNIKTSTISYDDGTNQGYAVINSDTGEIIKRQVLAASKPSTRQPSEREAQSYYSDALRQDAQKGATLSQIFSIYTGLLDPNLIYQLYNANSKYGPDKGPISNLEKYGVKQPSL